MDLDAEKEGEDEAAEEDDVEGPPESKRRKTSSSAGQVVVWSFKPAPRANHTVLSAAADASAFSVSWGGDKSKKPDTGESASKASRRLELSRIAIELHQVK